MVLRPRNRANHFRFMVSRPRNTPNQNQTPLLRGDDAQITFFTPLSLRNDGKNFFHRFAPAQ
jgi:hypothetical protein